MSKLGIILAIMLGLLILTPEKAASAAPLVEQDVVGPRLTLVEPAP